MNPIEDSLKEHEGDFVLLLKPWIEGELIGPDEAGYWRILDHESGQSLGFHPRNVKGISSEGGFIIISI